MHVQFAKEKRQCFVLLQSMDQGKSIVHHPPRATGATCWHGVTERVIAPCRPMRAVLEQSPRATLVTQISTAKPPSYSTTIHPGKRFVAQLLTPTVGARPSATFPEPQPPAQP